MNRQKNKGVEAERKVIPGESKTRIGAATNNRKNPVSGKINQRRILTWKN